MPLFEAGSRSRKAPHAAPDDQLNDGFRVETFAANFEALASAAGGAAALRRLILDLAVRGRLTSPTALAQATGGPFPIPDHWAWGRGDEVFAFVTSGSRGWAAYYAGDGPLFLRIGNLDYETTDLDLRSIQHVRPPKNAEGVRTRVEAGDILISITGDTGMVGLVPPNLGEAYINQHIALARPSANVWPAFVARALTAPSLLGRLQSAQRGIKNSLGLDDVRTLALPVPPLAEQKRIVARVDQLMAVIDDLEAKQTKKRDLSTRFTKASLDALTTADSSDAFDTAWQRAFDNFPTLIDRSEKVADLRNAVLELAFTGRLVGRLRSDSVVTALLAAIDAGWSRRSRKEMLPSVAADEVRIGPAHWTWVRLGNIAEVVGGVTKGRDLKGRKRVSLPYLRVANVQRGFLDLAEIKEIEIADDELPKYRLLAGDVLFTEGGDWDKLGRSTVWANQIDPCIHQNHVFRARLVCSELDPAWVSAFANSPVGRRYFEGAAKRTTNLASINMRQLRHCPIPLPPAEEKARIVAKVEHLMKLCDELEASLRRAEDRAGKLVEAVVREMVA